MSAVLAPIGGQELSAASHALAASTGRQKLSETPDRLQRRADAIEIVRLEICVPVAALCAAAGISTRTYSRHVAGGACGPAVLAKLERALASLRSRRPTDEALLIRATYGGFVVALCREDGTDPAAVHAQDPRRGATADPEWRRIARLRQAAIYLTNTAIVVKQRRLAAVLGLEPAAICLGLKSVEDRRDDPAFDRLLDRLAGEVMGEGAAP